MLKVHHAAFLVVLSTLAFAKAYATEPVAAYVQPVGPNGEVIPVPEPPPDRCFDRMGADAQKACCEEKYTISPADDGRYMNAVECCINGYETPDALACCTEVSKHHLESLSACPK